MMEQPLGYPLEIIFEDFFVINGPSATIQFPAGWRAREKNNKNKIYNGKIEILSVIAKHEIPAVLKNQTLLVIVEQLPNLSLLFGTSSNSEALAAPVLACLHFVQKVPSDILKIKLYHGKGLPLWPGRAVSKLTPALRSFPYDTSLSSVSLRLQFHIQLSDSD
ncbi:MAG: hypothetical protein GY738_09010 [Pseudoalteromonas sp.]|nr:hypothetical protein [Pseudoalteromonas sp.]